MAAIVNYRDLLLQASGSRFVSATTGVPVYVADLGDLAYQDQVNTGQIAPGAVTAGSGILAPGAVVTQAIAPGAITAPMFASAGASAYGALSAATEYQNLPTGTFIVIVSTYTVSHPGFKSANITIKVNGVTVSSNGFSFENFGNGVIACGYTIPALGNYRVEAYVNGESGGSCTGCSIAGFAGKR